MVHSPRANSSSSFCGQCKSFLLESELSRKYLKFTSNKSFSMKIRSSSYLHTLFSLLCSAGGLVRPQSTLTLSERE